MRAEDNSVGIAISPVAQAGNWLAVTGRGAYVLALTLYDTPASSSSGLGQLDMPSLVRGDCLDG